MKWPSALVAVSVLAVVLGCDGRTHGVREGKTVPPDAQPRHQLHLAISNQSRAVPSADVDVLLDGRRLVQRTLETGSQHSWIELTADAAAGRHSLVVRDTKSGKENKQVLNVNKSLWIVIMFTGDDFTIQVSDQQVGLM